MWNILSTLKQDFSLKATVMFLSVYSFPSFPSLGGGKNIVEIKNMFIVWTSKLMVPKLFNWYFVKYF